MTSWNYSGAANTTTDGYDLPIRYAARVWSPEVTSRIAAIVVIMVLTLAGNSALLWLIAREARIRRKRVNVFLINLAVSDLIICVVTMTTEVFFLAFGEWVFGAIACKLAVYAQMVTLAGATFLLTGMSIDHYQVGSDVPLAYY